MPISMTVVKNTIISRSDILLTKQYLVFYITLYRTYSSGL